MKTYGLIGFPLTQSFSKKYFTDKFESEKIDAQYLNFELESIGDFPDLIDDIENLVGLNVTIPYKEKVIHFVNELDKSADDVGAVNVIKIINSGSKTILVGYNSDAYGFEQTLIPHLKPEHTKALILGTGGASKAVKFVLKKLGIQYTFVSRRLKVGDLAYADITPKILDEFKLVVNTTPLGMFPNITTFPELPYHAIGDKHLFYDVVYNPPLTEFLRKAQQQGAQVVNGSEMLIKQAEKAWRIWNNLD